MPGAHIYIRLSPVHGLPLSLPIHGHQLLPSLDYLCKDPFQDFRTIRPLPWPPTFFHPSSVNRCLKQTKAQDSSLRSAEKVPRSSSRSTLSYAHSCTYSQTFDEYVRPPSMHFIADCSLSSLPRAEPHIHPRSPTPLGHSFRNLRFLPHPLPPYLHLTTRLPNVPQLHLRTRDPRGPQRVRPLLNLRIV